MVRVWAGPMPIVALRSSGTPVTDWQMDSKTRRTPARTSASGGSKSISEPVSAMSSVTRNIGGGWRPACFAEAAAAGGASAPPSSAAAAAASAASAAAWVSASWYTVQKSAYACTVSCTTVRSVSVTMSEQRRAKRLAWSTTNSRRVCACSAMADSVVASASACPLRPAPPPSRSSSSAFSGSSCSIRFTICGSHSLCTFSDARADTASCDARKSARGTGRRRVFIVVSARWNERRSSAPRNCSLAATMSGRALRLTTSSRSKTFSMGSRSWSSMCGWWPFWEVMRTPCGSKTSGTQPVAGTGATTRRGFSPGCAVMRVVAPSFSRSCSRTACGWGARGWRALAA